jgi:hypothetical protein
MDIEKKPTMTKEQAFQLARDYQKQYKCRWSEACLMVKRRFPESRALFGAPTLEELAPR